MGFAVDAADRESFDEFHTAATADGPLDALIINAGIMPIDSFLDQESSTYHREVAPPASYLHDGVIGVRRDFSLRNWVLWPQPQRPTILSHTTD